MRSIRIYGASDDLVEVDGDLSEEFNVLGLIENGPVYIAISTGTLIRITYDGFWNLRILNQGRATVEYRKATDSDSDYSDVVTVEGDDIEWVVCAENGIYHSEQESV